MKLSLLGLLVLSIVLFGSIALISRKQVKKRNVTETLLFSLSLLLVGAILVLGSNEDQELGRGLGFIFTILGTLTSASAFFFKKS